MPSRKREIGGAWLGPNRREGRVKGMWRERERVREPLGSVYLNDVWAHKFWVFYKTAIKIKSPIVFF